MASFTINGLDTTAESLAGVQIGIVGTAGNLAVNNADAVTVVDGTNPFLMVAGAILGAFDDGVSGENYDIRGGLDVMVTSTGQIAAKNNAIVGDFETVNITNDGLILGQNNAIQTDVNVNNGIVTFVNIFNTGEITGYNGAINSNLLGDSSFASFSLHNSGVVDGGRGVGVQVIGGDDTSFAYVENHGTIRGTEGALGTGVSTTVLNRGSFQGDVNLSNYDDIFNSRQGEVEGDIFANDGDDLVRGGSSDDNIDGGNDNDTLYGYGGDDTILGNAGFDTLHGGGGDDSLDGGGRSDEIAGGRGNDTMTGGGGGDTFVIRRVGNGDDEVTDFQNGSDVVDLSVLGIQNFNELNNTLAALSQDQDSVIIDLEAAGGSGSLRLVGVTLADMDASDFIF